MCTLGTRTMSENDEEEEEAAAEEEEEGRIVSVLVLVGSTGNAASCLMDMPPGTCRSLAVAETKRLMNRAGPPAPPPGRQKKTESPSLAKDSERVPQQHLHIIATLLRRRG
jgi:hypothetical protein